MVHSSLAGLPKTGDIVLKPVADGSRRYALGTTGHAAQIMCATYEEALAEAGRFARAQGLDVWQTHDDHTFSRILECRPASSA
jgi:hypothetical protein